MKAPRTKKTPAKQPRLTGDALERKLRAYRARLANPKPRPRKALGVGRHVPFESIVSLLGKPVGAPAVRALIESTAASVTKTGYVISKEAGFDFALGASPDDQRDTRPITGIFLYAEGVSRHRAFADLQPPLSFRDRATLHAAMPAPLRAYSLSKGRQKLIPLDAKDVYREEWKLDGLTISAFYDAGVVTYFHISR